MNEEYSIVINENMDKGEQLRLTLSDFRDVTYLHLRKYFLDYEGEWMPSKEGASMPVTLNNTYALLDGMLEILSEAEGDFIIDDWLEQQVKNRLDKVS